MKLYLISQNENSGWDTYDSAVVSASNENQARKIDPSKFRVWDDENQSWLWNGNEDYHDSWASHINNVSVEEIGEYNGTESKVILASFNAG